MLHKACPTIPPCLLLSLSAWKFISIRPPQLFPSSYLFCDLSTFSLPLGARSYSRPERNSGVVLTKSFRVATVGGQIKAWLRHGSGSEEFRLFDLAGSFSKPLRTLGFFSKKKAALILAVHLSKGIGIRAFFMSATICSLALERGDVWS